MEKQKKKKKFMVALPSAIGTTLGKDFFPEK
jgi:hypothetical protein